MSQQDTISVTYGSTQKRMWRIEPQEEYIWSMRFYKSIEEKAVDVAVSESGTEIARTSRNLTKSDIFNFTQPEKIQKQVKMFASFLPDETLLDVDDYTPREIECCLLYGRITGMHGLIERSHKMKADFKLKLTNQLNQFIGAMVQEILSNGGDILKFSPAAIVAIWKCTKGAYITQNVHIAIDCALVIQRQYGKFILESGEKLKVDFAITAGSVYFCLIGNEKCTKSVIFGAVYEDVRKARKMVALKNIIVSPKAMQFIHSFEYKLEQIEYGTFFQVIGLTKMWKQVRRNDYQDTASFHHLETVNTSFITINTTNVTTAETKQQGSFTEFCLRPIVQELVSYNGERFIANVQKFFDPGIRDAILADEPTDNLVELRDVIMVTILVVTSIAKSIKMLKATDDIFKKVERYAAKFEGYINYVSILDNSTMITIVFGLKSMAHVMQHRSALTCAFEIMGVLKYGPKISVVTIGLSTGKAYYTVVGHGLRQDISLFGKTITDAITLASKFNDKIVCDQDTFIHSRMKPSCFRLIKEREKSEMEDVLLGSVYELLTDDFDLLEELPVYDQPTIGRDKEISIYNKVCGKFFKKSRMKNHMKKVHNALYIKGYSKEGKSRLLHELIKVTSPNIPVHFIPLHNEDKDTIYFSSPRRKTDDIHSAVLEVHLTKHYAIAVLLPAAKNETVVEKLSKKLKDHEGLTTHIISIDFDSMLGCEDVDGAFVQFVQILKNAVKQFTKEVPVRMRNKNHKEWIIEELGRWIKSNNEMYRRCRVVNLIKTTKNDYYRSLFEEKNKSPEALWHWLGEATNSYKCKTCAIEKIADIFNNHCSTIGKNLKSKIKRPKCSPFNDTYSSANSIFIPYFFVRKIFSIVFDCNLLSSTREDRKHELQLRLADMPKIDLRCSINPVFHVNFPETEDFWKFSSEEKFREMLKILKYLCKKVFAINWLIAVDDADRLDKESWRVLEALLETKTFFLVMTANRDHSLSASNQRNFSRNPNVVKLKIETLSPNYISAIVCQHFRVFAIPPELEYMLQKTSNGNIGFIKNVLTNLRHRSFFSFKEISYLEATENNMVIPSMNLIIPIPDSEKQSLMMFIAKKGKYDKNEFKRILWYLFVESFQNKKFIHMRDKVYEIVLKTKKFRVCYLVKEINMDLMPNDLTTNIQITQTFEMLSYPEQMILKCCSILGDTFSRMVIEHVLPLDYYNLLAPAVKSFFEMGILCCGRGDFSDGVQFLVYREKCQDPRFDDDMTCKCRGLYTQDRFKKLPTYAYCGLLRFKYSQFREIIYDQLREVQKVDFHAKVIIFLHEETKRCRACGRDSFDWDNQKRLDEYAKRRKQGKNKKRFSQRLEYDFDLMNTTFHELFYDELPFPHKGSMSSRTGSAVSLDYSYCRESEVPITLCQFIRLLDNMQRYAYLCITNKNISEAHLILKQATGCINDIFEMENPPPKWKRKLFEAKILTISALAFKELGLLTEAEAHLKMAMEKFGVKFPRGRIGKLLSLAKVKLQKVLTFYAFPEMQTKTLNFCICEYYVNVAEALDLYAKFLMAKKQWEAAELVASWALYRALNAQTDFVRICDCFCNMILISIRAKNRSMNIALEVHALRYCYRKTNRIESWDLAAVCRLYSTIVVGKFIRAELDFSIHMGYIIIRMAACLNDTEKLLLISSYLVTVLMGKLYLQEAASLLLELEFCSENIDDLPGQIWFHSQALLFHMEIGYCIVPYQQCLSFMEIQANKLNDVTYNDAIKRLIILMWLWCLRNEQWERAARFDQYIKTTSDVHQGHVTIRTVLSLMYVLEGYLLLYVHKLNKSNINLARQYHKSVKSLLKLLEKESKFMVVLKSKLFALKAYYFFVKNDINKAFRWLQKSEKAAKKNGITLMEEWLKHTRKAWNNELPSKKKNFWKDHSGENNLVFYQEFDFNTDDIGFFTLPPPLYV
ncbi:hypothetical protein HHI36_000760 [Cryptolaemus montrouzieri]|uniref:Adenylate cyclase type 10 n=1 Tax=Cryptolaemus montrouzieri TaxID=559131 RepID=A0ABD2P6Y3_9CUCU